MRDEGVEMEDGDSDEDVEMVAWEARDDEDVEMADA